jgi:hypothetical protein
MTRTTVTLEVNSPEQEVLLRQYHGLLLELEQLALSAPEGQILDVCEAAVLKRGQDISRKTLQQLVQQRIEALEKKGRRCEPVPAAGHAKTAAPPNAKS